MIKRMLCGLLALVLALLPMQTLAEEWIEIVSDVKVSAAAAEGAQDQSSDPEDWWNILLLGCDSYTKNEYSRTDSMIILSVNKKTGRAKMTSLMRDTWVSVPGKKKSHRKLTELCVVGGPEMTIQAIEDSFGVEIEDYVLISMEGIAEVIDLLGGINLDVTEAERKALNKGLFDLSPYSGMEKLEKSGDQVHLNGNQATAFARIRNIDSDFVRTERQRTVLITMARKIQSEAGVGDLLSIITTMLDFVETTLGLIDIMNLAEIAMDMDLSTIEELRLPADGTYDSGTFDGVWCIKPDFKKNKQILQEFIYG